MLTRFLFLMSTKEILLKFNCKTDFIQQLVNPATSSEELYKTKGFYRLEGGGKRKSPTEWIVSHKVTFL